MYFLFVYVVLEVLDNVSPVLLVGAGWLGEPLARSLLQLQCQIVVTARKQERIAQLQASGLSAWRLDLADPGETFGLKERLQPFQTLILAIPPGRSGTSDYATQIQRLLTHWPEQPGRKLVFYSSTAVYPDAEGVWEETSALKTEHSVTQAEAVVRDWGNNHLILRCGGLCDEGRVIGRYFEAKALSNADQPVNYIHREDVIAATLWLLSHTLTGNYNLVAPNHPSRSEVFLAQAKRYGFAPPVELQGGGLNRLISVEKLLATGYSFRFDQPTFF